jgi:hypothetical protein
MSNAASEVSICNQAILWLGGQSLISLDDNSKMAEWCKNNYHLIRDAVLEEISWMFASDRATSTVEDKDAWGQRYSHPLPQDWLLVQGVFTDVSSLDPSNWIPDEAWEREGNKVLANNGTVYMIGTRRVTDTGQFSAMFTQALAARIAADAAIPLTQNRLLQRDMWALYMDKIHLAGAREGRQGKNERKRARVLERRR